MRRHHVTFHEAARLGADITRPDIAPGAALGLTVARRLAGFAGRVGRHLDVAIVPAGAVDGEFPHAVARLDDAGAAHSGSAGAVFDPGGHLALEPAHRRAVGARIVEAPG